MNTLPFPQFVGAIRSPLSNTTDFDIGRKSAGRSGSGRNLIQVKFSARVAQLRSPSSA
jgi:hypothetical protein